MLSEDHYNRVEPREKMIGRYQYDRSEDGTIHIYNTFTEEEEFIKELSPEDRRDFFDDMFEKLMAYMPQGSRVLESGNSIILVPDDHVDGEQDQLASIRYQRNGSVLKVELIESRINHGAKLMLAAVLKHFPETSCITRELADVNETAYAKSKLGGMDHLRALKETPAYKYSSALGFNGIDIEQSDAVGSRGRRILASIPLDPA